MTGVPVSGEGMTANLYEGLGWKYATMKENGRTRAALYITTPDGNPVDLSSDTINPYHKAIAVEQITFANVTVTGIVAEGSVGAENTIIQDGTFQKDVYMDENSTIAGGTFQDVVRAYGKITGGAFNAEVQLNQNSEVTGGVFHDVQLPSYATEKTVIRDAMILGSLKTDSDSKAAISNTVSCGYIESRFLAAGQQQSKLMMTDGTVKAVDSNAVTADAVYLVGNTAVTLTFSTKVTNINGEDVSAYNGAQLSADGKTLTLTAKNDGEPIVVNMAATGKLPFSSLSKSDFTVSGTIIGPQTVKSSKEGVGKLSLVYVRTSDNKVFATYPPYDEYGVYKQRIVAQEGDKYTEGSLDIGEVVRKYTPSRADFAYDSKTQTATYNGKMYFDDAPLYSIQYGSEDGSFPSVTKPTKAGTYSVYIVVDSSDHYVGNQYEVDTYTVSESKYTLTVDDKSTEHVAGEKLSFTAAEKDGYTFTGWEVTGLPTDVDTTKATISFTMPANNVTLKAQYTENAPKTYKLDVTDAKVTLKDGGAVADLTAVRVGTELVATAPEKDGYTFTGWEVDGVPEGTDTTKATISFKMPANKVTLTPQYEKNTYTLTVDGKDEQRTFDEEVTVTAPKKDGYTFTGWEKEGLPADAKIDGANITFKMPANNVTLKAQYNEIVPEKYTVTMGDEDTDYAVDADVSITAPEKDGYTFTGWDAVGVPEGTDTTSETISFKMPANNVTLKPQYEKNTYTLTVDGKDEQRTFDEEVTVTAPKKDGYTFTGWEVTGLPTDVDTTKATISFTMPANKVTLKAQYTENVPEKYTVTMGDETTEYAVGADVTIIAPAKAGETFTGWDAVGVPEGTDTNSETITFKMPKNNVTLTPQYKKDSTPTPAPGGDSDGGGAAIVAVAAVGGAAIGVGAYIAGTTAYLKSVLPEGMAIPANRQQLAVALWTAAGKPATQSTALFNDVAADAAELQAIRWVVETGLMSAQDGSFKPGSRVGRMEVIRTWKTYQQRG